MAGLATQKLRLLQEVGGLGRGAKATPEDRRRVEQLCRELERRNPTPKPLASSLINGRWELRYTTSASIVGTNKPPFLRPRGPIYQTIDAPAGRARNRETWPFFSEVSADLTPLSVSSVKVQFDEFKILGLIPVKAPPSAVGPLPPTTARGDVWDLGTLDTTFLDEELRISRGDKGNVFVLTMDDPSAKP